MRTRTSTGVRSARWLAVVATLLLCGASAPSLAAGVADNELRGYKGGLVEITLRDGTNVFGVLFGYTDTHLELELAGNREVKLHRTWITAVKAAPAGSQKSAIGAFPRGGSEAYRAEAPPPRETPSETPRETPPTARPAETPTRTPAAAAAPEPTGDIRGDGVVFQLRMGGNLLAILGGGIASWLNSSFMFGLKRGRLTIGLGLEMTYSDDNYPNTDPGPTETSTAMVLFQPTLEYYLAMKAALALYISAGLHLGFLNNHREPNQKDITDPMVGFHLGLGLRYFFAPRFAVGIEGGLRGAWVLLDNDESTNQDDEHTGVLSLYGAATLTAIW